MMLRKEARLLGFITKISSYCIFLFVSLVSGGCQSGARTVPGDDLISVRVCGDALYGNNPCDWVAKLDFTLAYLGENKAIQENLRKFIQDWVEQRKWEMNENLSIEVNSRNNRFTFFQPSKDAIKVTIFVYEEIDVDIVTVSTHSHDKYQTYSFACLGDNAGACLQQKIDTGLAMLLNGSFEKE